jgi:hypothetical protein
VDVTDTKAALVNGKGGIDEPKGLSLSGSFGDSAAKPITPVKFNEAGIADMTEKSFQSKDDVYKSAMNELKSQKDLLANVGALGALTMKGPGSNNKPVAEETNTNNSNAQNQPQENQQTYNFNVEKLAEVVRLAETGSKLDKVTPGKVTGVDADKSQKEATDRLENTTKPAGIELEAIETAQNALLDKDEKQAKAEQKAAKLEAAETGPKNFVNSDQIALQKLEGQGTNSAHKNETGAYKLSTASSWETGSSIASNFNATAMQPTSTPMQRLREIGDWNKNNPDNKQTTLTMTEPELREFPLEECTKMLRTVTQDADQTLQLATRHLEGVIDLNEGDNNRQAVNAMGASGVNEAVKNNNRSVISGRTLS